MLKSAYEKIDGLVYLPRMLEKIRLHARGELPEDYIPYLGSGFDKRCVDFLGLDYESLKEKVLDGSNDSEIVAWCKQIGTSRTEVEKEVWNEFMMKRGWRDLEPSCDDFQNYKIKYGYGSREDIKTYFDFFEVDEGRAK